MMTALVTGGARGIGAAIASRLAETGYDVVIADVDGARGQQMAGEIGGRFVLCDVTEAHDLQRAVAVACGPSPRLEVLSLNAGGLFGTDLGDTFDLGAYRHHFAVHVDGVVFGIQASLDALSAGGGSVLVTASLAGLLTNDNAFYAAAKHALVGLVRSAAEPLRARGVTINALCPGYTDTEFLDARARDWLAGQNLALATTGEIANAAEHVLRSGQTGQAWAVQADQPATPAPMPDIQVSRCFP